MPGYSHTPLLQKLGIKTQFRIYIENSPLNFFELLGPLPDGVEISKRLIMNLDYIHFFSKSKMELEKSLLKYKTFIKPTGMIWISWPKKSSKVKTDITEDTIREICLPMDLVDIKVCAIDEIWSGLKLVIRKEKR